MRIPTKSVDGENLDVICEVEQHLGENRVRTVAMKRTDGMQRGMQAVDTGVADFHAGRHRRRSAGS